jgi:RNA polymerase-binding transcription factor DksA
MPNPSQVCNDGDAFENAAATVNDGLSRISGTLARVACSNVCLECGGHITAARRVALPSATTCVPCQEIAESP